MKKLAVSTGDAVREICFAPGSSLRDILDAAGLSVRSGCRGNGACGLCLVQIESGNVNGLTSNERLLLSAEQIEQRTRLACHVMPESDLCVRRVSPVCKPKWRVLADKSPAKAGTNGNANGNREYGLAVDLGTTHISMSLWDVREGKRICGRIGPNPQSRFGADVMTRLIAAGESPEIANEIARLPLDAIGEALRDMESREGVRVGQVRQVGIVGNTPMLALLSELDSHVLLQPSSWTRPMECQPRNIQAWASRMGDPCEGDGAGRCSRRGICGLRPVSRSAEY